MKQRGRTLKPKSQTPWVYLAKFSHKFITIVWVNNPQQNGCGK